MLSITERRRKARSNTARAMRRLVKMLFNFFLQNTVMASALAHMPRIAKRMEPYPPTMTLTFVSVLISTSVGSLQLLRGRLVLLGSDMMQ